MKPTNNINAVFIATFFIMIPLTLPAQAQEVWSGAGMRPVPGAGFIPHQGQPVRHEVHVNVRPQVRVESQRSVVRPARPAQHDVSPVINHGQNVDHQKADVRRAAVARNSFYHNEGFYRRDNDFFPYVTAGPTIDLPDGLETVAVDGQTFFYSDGIFYQEVGGQLTVIPPVPGAVVDSIPPDYQVVMADGVNYLYAEGVFYQRVAQGFEVIESPVSDQE